MLPSRGLRWSSQNIGTGRRRLELLSARQFSSLPVNGSIRRNTLLQKTGASSSRTFTRPQLSQSSLLIRNGAATRFASTTPVTAAATASSTPAAATPTEAVGSTTSLPPTTFDEATDLTTNNLLYDIPEHIGYLKSLGLDYGWGPTSFVEWTLEHVHVLAGTPWWASIALTAILTRIVFFKPFMDATENAAKMATISHITKPLSKKMTEASQNKDTETVMKIRRELALVHKRAGVKMWKSLVPMVNVFIGYGSFKLMRGMANLPVPGFETGGIMWFENLCFPDPLLILPLSTAAMLHFLIKRGGETGVQTVTPAVQKIMMYGLPALTVVFTSWMPAALQLSFFIQGLAGFFQAKLFRNPRFRTYFKMTPLPKPQTPDSGAGPRLNINPASTPAEVQKEVGGRWKNVSGVKDVMGAYQEARGAVKEVTGRGKEGVQDRVRKQQLAEAAKYEEKRQQQLKEERWEREAERRRERAARRSMK